MNNYMKNRAELKRRGMIFIRGTANEIMLKLVGEYDNFGDVLDMICDKYEIVIPDSSDEYRFFMHILEYLENRFGKDVVELSDIIFNKYQNLEKENMLLKKELIEIKKSNIATNTINSKPERSKDYAGKISERVSSKEFIDRDKKTNDNQKESTKEFDYYTLRNRIELLFSEMLKIDNVDTNDLSFLIMKVCDKFDLESNIFTHCDNTFCVNCTCGKPKSEKDMNGKSCDDCSKKDYCMCKTNLLDDIDNKNKDHDEDDLDTYKDDEFGADNQDCKNCLFRYTCKFINIDPENCLRYMSYNECEKCEDKDSCTDYRLYKTARDKYEKQKRNIKPNKDDMIDNFTFNISINQNGDIKGISSNLNNLKINNEHEFINIIHKLARIIQERG